MKSWSGVLRRRQRPLRRPFRRLDPRSPSVGRSSSSCWKRTLKPGTRRSRRPPLRRLRRLRGNQQCVRLSRRVGSAEAPPSSRRRPHADLHPRRPRRRKKPPRAASGEAPCQLLPPPAPPPLSRSWSSRPSEDVLPRSRARRAAGSRGAARAPASAPRSGRSSLGSRRRQGRARRRRRLARVRRRARRPFRAVHGRVLDVGGVARHFFVRALAGNGSAALSGARLASAVPQQLVCGARRTTVPPLQTRQLFIESTCAMHRPPVRACVAYSALLI